MSGETADFNNVDMEAPGPESGLDAEHIAPGLYDTDPIRKTNFGAEGGDHPGQAFHRSRHHRHAPDALISGLSSSHQLEAVEQRAWLEYMQSGGAEAATDTGPRA